MKIRENRLKLKRLTIYRLFILNFSFISLLLVPIKIIYGSNNNSTTNTYQAKIASFVANLINSKESTVKSRSPSLTCSSRYSTLYIINNNHFRKLITVDATLQQ